MAQLGTAIATSAARRAPSIRGQLSYMHFPPKPCAEWHSVEAEPVTAAHRCWDLQSCWLDVQPLYVEAHNLGPAAHPVSGS